MIVQEQDTTHFCRDPPIINNVRFIFVSIHKLTVRKIRLDSTDSLMLYNRGRTLQPSTRVQYKLYCKSAEFFFLSPPMAETNTSLRVTSNNANNKQQTAISAHDQRNLEQKTKTKYHGTCYGCIVSIARQLPAWRWQEQPKQPQGRKTSRVLVNWSSRANQWKVVVVVRRR